MTLFRTAALLLVAGTIAAACGGISSPSNNRTQDFSGTLVVGGSNTYPFSTSKSGEFFIKVTELSDRTLTIGTGLGQIINGGCSPLGGYYLAPYSRWNQQSLTGPINHDNYCLIVYDPGTLTAPINFTVQVSYP